MKKLLILIAIILISLAFFLFQNFPQKKLKNMETYEDANKYCYDSSQCQGRCIFDDSNGQSYVNFAKNFKNGDRFKVSGKCEENSSPFKCSAEVKNGYIDSPIACVDPEPQNPTANPPSKIQSVSYSENAWIIEFNKQNYSVKSYIQNLQDVIVHGFLLSLHNNLYLSYSVGKKHYFSKIDLNSLNLKEVIIAEQLVTSPLSLNIPVSLSPNESYLLYISKYELTFVPLTLLNLNTLESKNIPITVKLDYKNYKWSSDESFFDFEYYKLEDQTPPVKFSTGNIRYHIKSSKLNYL